tara:strand:- start:61929 stop:63119 length:1191 start_codon:yes stop_codon:yes gene_type:complete
MSQNKKLPVFSVSLMITGNMVGAGILGLPINTGLVGLWPALGALVATWAMMFATAWIIARQAINAKTDDFDLPSLFGQVLGPAGKWLAIIGNLVILYGLLVAYLSGATTILFHLFDLPFSYNTLLLAFFTLTTGLTLFGVEIVRKTNALMTVLMWVAFIAMVCFAGKFIQTANMNLLEWRLMPIALPVIATAFHFHNIIPTVCGTLEWDKPAIKKAILTGTLIGLAMNIAWTVAAVGALPLSGESENTIRYAFYHNEPATIPLSKLINSQLFTIAGLVFALLAILTSYITNAIALMHFIRDMLHTFCKKRSQILEAALTFLIPLGLVFAYPNIFLRALDVVGGIGVVLLFGALPSLLYIKYAERKHDRFVGMVLLGLFCFALFFAIMNILGHYPID